MTYSLYQIGTPTALSPQESADLAARVASLASSGMPLESGLRALADELPGQQRVLRNLAARLSRGEPFDQAALAADSRLPATLRGLIAAGLRSGRLPQVLDEYATLVRRQQTYRRQASLVLIYPAILSCIMAGLMLYFRYVFMRDLSSIFRSYGTQLPPSTEFVIWMTPYATWIMLFLALALCLTSIAPIVMTRFQVIANLFGYLPVLGPLMRARQLAMVCELLAMLLENNVPIPESLELAAIASDNPALAATLRTVAESARNGVTLDQALAIWELPKRLEAIISWGQSAGNLPAAFRAAADSFECQLQSKRRFLELLIGPVFFLMIAGGAGLIIVALMMPLINLIRAISSGGFL